MENLSWILKRDNQQKLLLGTVFAVATGSALSYWAYLQQSHNKPSNLKKSASFSKSPSFFELTEEEKGQEENRLRRIRSEDKLSSSWTTLGLKQPLIIVMVGLPARGKSYLVKMIMRYLKWTGFECKVFNVGNYRRKVGLASADASFFDSSNPDAKQMRENLAMSVQDSMYLWLLETPDMNEIKRRVAIFDATNTTKSRRLALAQRARKEGVFLLFVESICDDHEVLMRNYELKLQNDDYKGMDPAQARQDFMTRVAEYEKVYETITDEEDNSSIAYIKLINVGQKVITRNCHGFLPSQVAFYLQNVHIQPRRIFLSIKADSVHKSRGETSSYSYGSSALTSSTSTAALTDCSAELTKEGLQYSRSLAEYIQYEQEFELVEKGKEIIVLTGTAPVHFETVAPMKAKGFNCFHTPMLNELRGGDFHGLSHAEMKALHPEEYEKRQRDKLNYRYPGVGGESYLDVIERVKPVIIELERQRRSLVVVCHVAVMRCIYAYFMGVPLEEIPYKEFETHKIYELSPGPFGCACSIVNPDTSRHSTK